VRTIAHRREDSLDERKWNVIVKEVAHRIHEHDPRLAPAARNVQQIRMQRHLKAVTVAIAAHGLQALRHPFGVTVSATFADLGAPGDRIPSHFGPFDVGSRRHGNLELILCFCTVKAAGLQGIQSMSSLVPRIYILNLANFLG